MTYLNGLSSSPGEGPLRCTIRLHPPTTLWFYLTDSQEAVITIHNLNGNQSACPAGLIRPQGVRCRLRGWYTGASTKRSCSAHMHTWRSTRMHIITHKFTCTNVMKSWGCSGAVLMSHEKQLSTEQKLNWSELYFFVF